MPRALNTLALLLFAGSVQATPRWVELAPPPLAQGGAVYDSARSRMLIAAGSQDVAGRAVLWSLDLPGSQWREIECAGTAPPPSLANSMILDPVRDRLVVYASEPGGPKLYALDLSTFPAQWSAISATGTPPDGKSDFSVIYDPPRRRMIVFGGFISAGGGGSVYSNRTFALSLDGTPRGARSSQAGSFRRREGDTRRSTIRSGIA